MEAEVVRMCCTIFGGNEKTCGTVSLYQDSRGAVEARFFSALGLGEQKNKLKSTENDQLTGHFQSFFVFNISRKNQ